MDAASVLIHLQQNPMPDAADIARSGFLFVWIRLKELRKLSGNKYS
ncbi:MAG: hypothetical protein PVF83_17640 [Anaerolineales bacterium]